MEKSGETGRQEQQTGNGAGGGRVRARASGFRLGVISSGGRYLGAMSADRLPTADRGSRTPEVLARLFHWFARKEAPELASPMYAELCYGISGDAELLALAARVQPSQPAPNVLLASVQYLLLCGAEHPLAAHYPAVTGQPRPFEPASWGAIRGRPYICRPSCAVRTRFPRCRLASTSPGDAGSTCRRSTRAIRTSSCGCAR